MRPKLSMLLAGAALAVLGVAVQAQFDLASAPRISMQEFKKLHDAGALTVVDVRDVDSFRLGHIPGSLSIPLDDIPRNRERLKAAKKPIVTYCA